MPEIVTNSGVYDFPAVGQTCSASDQSETSLMTKVSQQGLLFLGSESNLLLWPWVENEWKMTMSWLVERIPTRWDILKEMWLT